MKKIESPLISIIIPVYNGERYVDKCLNSVLNQSLDNIEIIIVDDGSTDKTKLIIERYINQDDRIKYIYTENSGVSNARNIGIEIARGKYIGFVDSDDYIKIDMFEVLYNKVKLIDGDIGYCGHTSVNIQGEFYEPPCNHQINITSEDDMREEIYQSFIDATKLYLGMCWNKIYRRSLIIKNNIKFDTKRSIGEDFHFNLQAFTFAKKCVIIPDSLYYYNKTNISSTRRYIKDMIYIDILNYKTRIEYIDKWGVSNQYNISQTNKIFIKSIYACIRNEVFNINNKRFSSKLKAINNLLKNKSIIMILNKEFKASLNCRYRMKYYFLKSKSNLFKPTYFIVLFNLEKFMKLTIGFILKNLARLGIGIKREKPYIYIER